ncbi:hypothetical protein [Actinophytocola sediminis]
MKGTGHVFEEPFVIGQDPTIDSATAAVARLVPAVMFGLRTAALAGMVVTAGTVALGLSGVFDDSTNVAFTTCCGGELDLS